MNKLLIRSFLSLFLTGLCIAPLWAQYGSSTFTPENIPSEPTPASSTEKTEKKKTDPFGINVLGKDRPKDAKTEITAKNEATFNNETNTATFVGNVVVKDAQFTLFCDNLVVTLNKNRKGMERAEAIGHVVIVQENTDEKGKVVKAIGRSGKAIYNPLTGEVTLLSWPSIQHGVNNQVATEEGTIMILNRNGRSQTTGGSKTMISETGEAS